MNRPLGRRGLVVGALAGAGVLACSRRDSAAVARTGPRRRVVSQTVLSDEVLWDLGPSARAQVVAVSSLADDARYSLVADTWPPDVLRAPLTAESLLSLAPDLVIVADFTADTTRHLVTEAGVRSLELSGFDGFDDYRRHVREIAAAVELASEGDALVQAFDARLDATRRSPAERPGAVSWTDGNVAAGGTTFDDIAAAAGLRNLAAEHGHRGHVRLSVEQLVAWDPECIVIPCGPSACEAAAAEVATLPGLSATRAAREGGIVAIPSAQLYASGVGMLDVVERLAAARPEGTRGP